MGMEEYGPEWIITTYEDANPRKVDFLELLGLRDQISSALLLWNFNSYYINLSEAYFIINGGRKIQPTVFFNMTDRKFLYARRHRETLPVGVDLGNENRTHEVFYLLGVEGMLEGEKKELLLLISSDGTLWKWIPKR